MPDPSTTWPAIPNCDEVGVAVDAGLEQSGVPVGGVVTVLLFDDCCGPGVPCGGGGGGFIGPGVEPGGGGGGGPGGGGGGGPSPIGRNTIGLPWATSI
ncbi:MAG: hypothetical protein ACOYOM_15890, partial [Chloroflexota bacterium]